ncbi:hypothetical protein N2S64_17830, partial [Escherichia coli]|nr:hypothetical protein [Escherichia coli]
MTHFSQQDNFSVAARVLGALFYYAPESAEAAPLVAVLTNDGWETQWPLPEASLAPLVTAFQTQCEETHAQACLLFTSKKKNTLISYRLDCINTTKSMQVQPSTQH